MISFPQAIPKVLHPLLHDYLGLLEQKLPGFVSAFYVVGSIALAGFNPGWSDVDFLAVLGRLPSGNDLETLKRIHAGVAQRHPIWKLEGGYLQPGDLGRYENEVQPFPAIHDSKLELSIRFELNPVTWWILKNRGITIFGQDAESLPISIQWESLVRWMQTNLNTYWASWTYRPDGLLALLSDYGVQWSVLGVLRQYYSFRERSIISKIAAGKYALAYLPAQWHRLIQESIAIREGGGKSLYGSRIIRALESLQFLRFIIRTCNEMLAEQSPPI